MTYRELLDVLEQSALTVGRFLITVIFVTRAVAHELQGLLASLHLGE